uniref:Integrin beta-1-binding protein 2 n=1 Tax=Schistosoma japonicum TaxID=6182 RepID=C1L5K9_SCHJA|nr:Integrin beta-1-binding protein 2 [Schistosoma japonicum]
MANLLLCYNKGCAQKFNPDENSEDSCRYHPGEPIFHDAKKKWSCCNKYSTDFSEFLSIKGCTVGKHNNVRPENNIKEQKKAEVPVKPLPMPMPISKPIVAPRPSCTEPTYDLPVEITSNLKSSLEKLSLDPSFKPLQTAAVQNTGKGIPPIGTNCKNTACKQVYTGTDVDSELCLYHPGVAVFHEGMKYWTCCNQKTSEFEAFVKQVGCTTGRHNWTVEDAKSMNATLTLQPHVNCRFDWYQCGGFITLNIYAKNIWPETVSVKANQIILSVSLKFGVDYQIFEKDFNLYSSIDPNQSVVKLMPLKAEIILKKAEPISWSKLEYCKSVNENTDNSENNNDNETVDN